MEELSIKFENCYGIKKLEQEFDFKESKNKCYICKKWIDENIIYKSIQKY